MLADNSFDPIGIIATVGEKLRDAGAIRTKHRGDITAFVTAALVGEGHAITVNGAEIRMSAFKKNPAPTASWFVRRVIQNSTEAA